MGGGGLSSPRSFVLDPIVEQPGDVVGRDLDIPLAGSLGHVGLWDGYGVIEVLDEGRNAIRVNSLDNFKTRTRYWGAAFPKIPTFTVYNCFDVECRNLSPRPIGQVQGYPARKAIAEWAKVQARIGASYTRFPIFRPAYPAEGWAPMRPGEYRCDTFVLAAYLSTTHLLNNLQWRYAGYEVPDPVWYQRLNGLLNRMNNGTLTPAVLFASVKSWQ